MMISSDRIMQVGTVLLGQWGQATKPILPELCAMVNATFANGPEVNFSFKLGKN